MVTTRGWATLCAVSTSALAAIADQPFVDPYAVSSPSGRWIVHVDPSSPEGDGPATYTMALDGRDQWKSDIELTLRECVVSDAGLTIGYAYDNGFMGWGGNVVVLAIGSDGRVIQKEARPRNGPQYNINPPPPGEPRGAGVLLDQMGQRAIVRMTHSDAPSSTWWIYSLRDGTRLGEQTPAPQHGGQFSFVREIDARQIPGCELIGIHWFVYEDSAQSAVFQLVDAAGHVVWSHRIDREYADRPRYWNWSDLLERHVEQLGVAPEKPSAFSIVSYSTGKRTHYSIEKLPDGHWSVKPTAEEAATPFENDPKGLPPAIAHRELIRLGELNLGIERSASPIDEIHGLACDSDGRMAWIRRGEGTAADPRFIMVNRAGQVVADIRVALPAVGGASLPGATWLDGDRWLIARSVHAKDDSSRAEAWFFNAANGELSVIEGFAGGSIERVTRTPDGGFVVLGSLIGGYTLRDHVTRYDPQGRQLSSKTEPGYGHGDLIMDIACLSDGTLALLTGVADRSEIKLIRPDKADPEVWKLADVLQGHVGPDFAYFAGLRPDKDGGLVVYDSGNQNHLHRIDKAGVCWQSFHVAGPNGEPFRLYDAFTVDPDGRVWASDGSRLYRVGDDGRADLALGGPAEGTMADPVAVALDKTGRIYALEKGTGAVHIFSPDGTPERVLRPEPGDTPTQDALAWIEVDDDGRVRWRMTYEGPIVTFDAEGRRVGTEMPSRAFDEPAPWSPVGRRWQQNGSAVRLLGPDGSTIRSYARRPSNAWIVSVTSAAETAAGSIAIVCERISPASMGMHPDGPLALCLYGPGDEEGYEATLPGTWPSPQVLCDDGRVFLADHSGVTLFRTPLRPEAERFDLPGGKEAWWKTMLRRDGTLATWAHGTRTIQLWKVPD